MTFFQSKCLQYKKNIVTLQANRWKFQCNIFNV